MVSYLHQLSTVVQKNCFLFGANYFFFQNDAGTALSNGAIWENLVNNIST